MVWIALSVMMASVLIVNLGLGEAIAEVTSKILKCPICLSFWGVFVALVISGTDVVLSVVLSIFMAYLSNFFSILLWVANLLYDKLWKRIKEIETRMKESKKNSSDKQ